ncbi:MAG: response regulator [Nitratireductor sp.]
MKNDSILGMRERGLLCLLTISIVFAVFVTLFNKRNSDIAYLAGMNSALSEISITSDVIKDISYDLEQTRDLRKQKIDIQKLIDLSAKLRTQLLNLEQNQSQLTSGVKEKFLTHAAFGPDYMWPEHMLVRRLEDVQLLKDIGEAGNFRPFFDENGNISVVVSGEPYNQVAKLVRQPLAFVVPPSRPEQKYRVNQFISSVSVDLKRTQIAFVLSISFVMLIIAFLVVMPLMRTVGKQIKDLQVANQKANSADRAKSEFLANMSHEIRTPMNGVMGMAELLAKTELDAKQKTFIDIITKSGASLLTIINDILDFSKIDAGQMELDNGPFKLAEAVEDVATLVSSKVAEKDLELIVRVDPKLPTNLIGDAGRIRQMLTNLLGNATKFTDEGHVFVDVNGSLIEDRMDDQGRSLYALDFRVEDTGVGIAKDKCAKVFENFSQVDTSATRKHEGTGLGLSITSSLVELMDGEIGVDSEEGVGSTFWFKLELPVHESLEDEMKVDRYAHLDLSGSRVLIVDDNQVNRSILGEQMAAWKFDSAAAVSGAEALAVMRAAREQDISIDAVILDFQMPEMNGGDVVRAMRADPLIADIPVVMLTSVEFTEDGKSFSSLGVEGHLTKPARSSLLLETLMEAISSKLIDKHNKLSKSIEGAGERRQITPEKKEAPKKTPLNGTGVQVIPNLLDEPHQLDDGGFSMDIDERAFDSELGETVFKSDYEILVCEDNEVNQIVFTQTLEDAGYQFIIASNGEIGVKLYQTHNPQLILMDVSMPKMNGLDATRKIRELEEGTGRHTTIIGVTAHAIKGDMEKCLEAGMDDYLPKPISPHMLVSKIEKYMNKAKQNSA